MPEEIVTKLHDAIEATITDPTIASRMSELGTTPVSMTPQEFQVYIVSEAERWAEIVRASGAKPEE